MKARYTVQHEARTHGLTAEEQQQSYRVEVQNTKVVIYCAHLADAYLKGHSLARQYQQAVFVFRGQQLVHTVTP
jgi:hypothetical protein